ncbi:MAG TPA: HisA/HisF-related TIM barrel protein [Methylomirabilota bacterium]|nr:HisA/HisF-related TIM barrel protein [Methylomirabilota bacterium]
MPVLDLKGGVAVHAVRGERHAYAPVRSVLSDSADPVALARAFRERLGADACYVADLDAIAGTGDHGPVVQAIAGLGLSVWLDAGVATAADAARAASRGVARVIVGTETLGDARDLPAIVTAARAVPGAGADCILSLDHRDGRLLGGSPAVAGAEAADLAAEAWMAGIRTFIVLDLARVGARAGPGTEPARWLRMRLPGAEIVLGGGVRGRDDLRALATAGYQVALVGTALHTGVLGAGDLVLAG